MLKQREAALEQGMKQLEEQMRRQTPTPQDNLHQELRKLDLINPIEGVRIGIAHEDSGRAIQERGPTPEYRIWWETLTAVATPTLPKKQSSIYLSFSESFRGAGAKKKD